MSYTLDIQSMLPGEVAQTDSGHLSFLKYIFILEPLMQNTPILLTAAKHLCLSVFRQMLALNGEAVNTQILTRLPLTPLLSCFEGECGGFAFKTNVSSFFIEN